MDFSPDNFKILPTLYKEFFWIGNPTYFYLFIHLFIYLIYLFIYLLWRQVECANYNYYC